MCLIKVIKRFEPNDDMVVGYKVFDILCGHPYSPYRRQRQDIGKHLTSTNGKIGFPAPSYERGFHFYTNINEAIEKACDFGYCVYEIHAWDIRATGIQSGYSVSVSKNIRVIRRVKI